MIEVMQADYEAAAKSHGFIYWESLRDHFGEGAATRIAEVFARHRIAAEQRGMIAGARLALEAAANGLEAHAKHYTEMKDAAKERKDKREVRDFETMAMACAFRSAEIRALDPAAIANMERKS